MNILFFSNKRILAMLLIGVVITSMSCKKELNQGPIDATYSQIFWTSQTNVEEAANAMYGQLRATLRVTNNGIDNNEGAFFVTGDFVAGLFSPASSDVFLPYGLTAAGKYNFSYVPYWEGLLQNWSRFYQVIALCNSMLQFVPNMSTSLFPGGIQQKNSYVAEAYFVRAYAYLYLIKLWGDPVYVTKTYNDVDFGNIPPLARSAEKNVLDSCLIDLRTAQSFMPYSGGNPTMTIRANKGSIQALMANIFAWEHNYDSTHYYCQQVIANGGYTLEKSNNYTNIWKGMSSTESIFELAMQYNASDPNFKSQSSWAEATFNFFGGFLQGSLVNNKRSSSWTIPLTTDDKGATYLSTYLSIDTVNDQRFKNILIPANNGSGYIMAKYANFQFGDKSTNSYPYIGNDLVLMRLAEMYLLDAEALASKGNIQAARSQLQVIEQRSGISSYTNPQNQTAMLMEIVMEEGREFIGEGHFFYDLIRTKNDQLGLLENLGYGTLNDRLSDASKGYYWPLQMNVLLNQDPLLTQNPWWTIHSGH